MGDGKYCIASDGELCGPGLQPLPFKVWYTPRNLETLGDIAFAQGAAMERGKMETLKAGIKKRLSNQSVDVIEKCTMEAILLEMGRLSGSDKEAENGKVN